MRPPISLLRKKIAFTYLISQYLYKIKTLCSPIGKVRKGKAIPVIGREGS
jgi:hypothetical protein